MSFFVVEVDGGEIKLLDSGGVIIDPAKEGTLESLRTTVVAIRDTTGIKKIIDALPVGDNGIGRIRLWDGANLIGILNDGGVYRLQVDAKLSGGGASQIVQIESGDGSGRKVNIDSSKRLLVSTPPPTPPPGTTPVNVTEIDVISNSQDTVTTITSGTTLTITRFSGGAEGGPDKQSKVTLFEDVDGTSTTLNLIRNAYLSGSNFDFALDIEFVGDGSRAIRMRRERLDGGSKEISGFWNGFEI